MRPKHVATASIASGDVLLDAARAGDSHALVEWLRREQALLGEFAQRLCHDDEVAKDVVQESMFAAARSVADFRSDGVPRQWLYTIVRSFCSKRHRLRRSEPRRLLSLDALDADDAELRDAAPTPAEIAESHELSLSISAALGTLEPIHREVLLLRDFRDLPCAEVAEILGINELATKSRLHRARMALRELLAERLLPQP
jgi:RNA polymerase sigma-70 factor (ECF subfamily)